jgi:hypothetical protein
MSRGIVGRRLRLFFLLFFGAAARLRGDATKRLIFLVGGSPFSVVFGSKSKRTFLSISVQVIEMQET